MTEEQIKKAVELAEGFKLIINSDSHEEIVYKDSVLDLFLYGVKEWEHYPLLLYRARETWNKKGKNPLDIVGDDFVMNNSFVSSKNYTTTSYLTAQEQALEEALQEVL